MGDFVATEIVKQFPTPAEPLVILDGVNVSLNRGQSLAVVGPSGSGKSTFLQIAGTLDQPTSGTIDLLGQRLNELKNRRLAEFRNHNLGFIFQDHHLLPQLSALENVLVPAVAQHSADQAAVERATDLLQRVGLGERASHRPAELSGGERQRVAVARALINDPVLILADEPTGSLDPNSADVVGTLLLELQAERDSILICVTHSRELAATFEQTVRLENGKFVPQK